jgi:uncharacterized membrane protein
MDKGVLVLLIPVLALATGLIAVLKMPRKAFTKSATPELEARVQALEEDLGTLRHELSEAHERLDFAERLLARVEEARRIDKGG